MLYAAVLYAAVLYAAVLYAAVLYAAVLYAAVHVNTDPVENSFTKNIVNSECTIY